MQFRRVRGRDSAQIVTPFVQVGTSSISPVSRGDRLCLHLRIDCSISRVEYRRTPLGFIASAIRAIIRSPRASRCAPSSIRRQICSKSSTSTRFADISGHLSKCGRMTSAIRGTLLHSHLIVWSPGSRRIEPQAKYEWIKSTTCRRSSFWLTETLGRTSHPTLRRGRGEMDTEKHPSPSK